MRLLVVFALVTYSLAAPQGYGGHHVPNTYSAPDVHGFGQHGFTGSQGFTGTQGFTGHSTSGHVSFGGGPCGSDQVRHVDGSCVTPIVNRNIYVYEAPRQHFNVGPPPQVPAPRVEHNIVFVQTPEHLQGQRPVVVPPPQQKTIVYVLNKKGQIDGQQVIEVPHTPSQPEVYYVNYNDGDNPSLPGGIDLQTALQTVASQQGKVIGGESSPVHLSSDHTSIGGEHFISPSTQYGLPF